MVTWQGRWHSVRHGGVVAALAKVQAGEPAEVIIHEHVTPDSAAVLAVMILSDAELAGRRIPDDRAGDGKFVRHERGGAGAAGSSAESWGEGGRCGGARELPKAGDELGEQLCEPDGVRGGGDWVDVR